MKKLFIIDGNSLANRAYYALPLLANSDGVYSNAVFGFINCIIKLITDHKPDFIVVAFDHARKTFRNEMFADYKATRKKMPDELAMQFPILKDILNSMNIKCIEENGIEADDIIGTIAKHSNCKNYIITGDRDSLQLIDDNTSVWLTQKGISDIKEINIENIKEVYNLLPSQVIDYKALAGDTSDNIPGVSGIGDKTALNLIAEYSNITNIYENLDKISPKVSEKLFNDKDKCILSYKLATIKTDSDFNYNINDFSYDYPFGYNTKQYFEQYSFKALLKKDYLFDKQNNENSNITLINNNQVLNNILDNFDNKYICLDLRDRLFFAISSGSYEISKDINLFDTNPVDIKAFFERIKDIIQNEKVLKIVFDLKNHMHIFNTDNIKNVFDINLAQYLISGGNKVEKDFKINEFFEAYSNQEKQLKDKNLVELYNEIELPLEYVLYNMEQEGFRLDIKTLNELKKSYSTELSNIEAEIKKYSKKENLNVKSTKQLAELLFEDLKLSDAGNKKHSTNVDVLNSLYNEHPVVPLILRYRKVQKIYSGYIEPYLNIIDKDGIIKTIFNQTLTSTGRLSSSEPNLQNIPVRDEEGKNLRRIFTSRFDNGSLMSADYNQIELRLLANFSGDFELINDYNNGVDIHKATASRIFNKPIDEVDEFERRMAKSVNFGIIYGISNYGLSKNLDISLKDASKYIELYFKQYPKTKEYLYSLIAYAKENGFVKTIYNRIRFIPEIKSDNGKMRQFGERVAMNTPLQGSASDIIKIAMIRVYNRIKKEKLNSKLILQIHDELIVDVYPSEEEKVKNILLEEMQNVYNNNVPLLVSIGNGKTWYDCK